MYYDDDERLIQTRSTNHLGGYDHSFTAYNFAGQPISGKHIHSATGQGTQTELYTYAYDHAGRLSTVLHRLNNGNEVALAANKYDELGRLKKNRRNGRNELITSYGYNIRSWVQNMSNAHFVENLSYTSSGNIRIQEWQQASKTRKYEFSYDPLSRLTNAGYMGDGNYNTSYSYDKQGNVINLSRWGNTGTTTYGKIDDLSLNYSGNQLIHVEDTGVDPTLSSSADFRGESTESIQYTYDANGNMKVDLNKGISNIDYNFLNLPSSLSISNNWGAATNTYVYSATGSKLSVTKGSFKTDYVGNVIYENNVLKRILVEGGYNENGVYYFYVRDHLGNNRIVANQNGGVVQSTQYYPYGMAFADGTGQDTQPYKYNGKELDNGCRLNLYDYSARYMDPALGRFTTMDPMAEKYYAVSPYAYCANNPVRYVDPTGMDSYEYDIVTNQFTWINNVGEKDVQHIDFINGEELVQAVQLNGPNAYVYSLSDGFVATNFDANLPGDYNENSGYEYSIDDFKMRNEITKSPNLIGTYIHQKEREGMAEPITRRDAENLYGSSLMNLIAFSRTVESALNLTDGGVTFSNKVKGFSRVSLLKHSTKSNSQGIVSSNKNNPWIDFLKTNKGKYRGKNWRIQATRDYYKSQK